jgi:hypothetical protein
MVDFPAVCMFNIIRFEISEYLRKPGPGKSKLDAYREEIQALLKTGSIIKYVGIKYGITSGNLLNWLKRITLTGSPILVSKI